MAQVTVDKPIQPDAAPQPASSNRWWAVMDMRIGIVPLPIFLIGVGVLAAFVRLGKVPADLTTNILTLTIGGFACAELGKHLPGLRKIGAAAILATFVPSFLVYAGAIPAPLKDSITTFTD